jgi:hypothetical protein
MFFGAVRADHDQIRLRFRCQPRHCFGWVALFDLVGGLGMQTRAKGYYSSHAFER